jgi:calcium-binding protein CML
MQFDTDGDGYLQLNEFKRAFRALGLKKRSGAKMVVDEKMFMSFDTNGDGMVSVAEFEENLYPKTREAIEAKLNEGWVFDKARWEASVARHSRWDMSKVFKQFDFDGDGYLDIGELQRAFRALGLKKRSGAKMVVDQATFDSFDTNGDGKVSLPEFEENLLPKTRAKIEEKLNMGWKFDHAKWAASLARHSRWNMEKVFKQFDTDGDGKLGMREFMRAFRALGLQKRSGEKMRVDSAMFQSFDTNGDGSIDLHEFETNLLPATRKKIEARLDAGWKFDAKAWAESEARHANN